MMEEYRELHRIHACFERAKKGEKLKIAFLGGSITQGALSSKPETCYAYLVYQWILQRFSKAEVQYINAGIGGTDSQFAVARVEEQVLSLHPDLVFVEFSVNDEANDFYMETFEGLLRRIYYHQGNPAVMVLNNFFYHDGHNAQKEHNQVATHYQIPYLSIRDALYPQIE
ncbi:MAG: SGNH/GDSL hydrolase family protein, partial [Vallitaleaceae bacterium]|nr:SGNH/GDSL hydrolase family protein [Vallitaleaceae bacterium]